MYILVICPESFDKGAINAAINKNPSGRDVRHHVTVVADTSEAAVLMNGGRRFDMMLVAGDEAPEASDLNRMGAMTKHIMLTGVMSNDCAGWRRQLCYPWVDFDKCITYVSGDPETCDWHGFFTQTRGRY